MTWTEWVPVTRQEMSERGSPFSGLLPEVSLPRPGPALHVLRSWPLPVLVGLIRLSPAAVATGQSSITKCHRLNANVR